MSCVDVEEELMEMVTSVQFTQTRMDQEDHGIYLHLLDERHGQRCTLYINDPCDAVNASRHSPDDHLHDVDDELDLL